MDNLALELVPQLFLLVWAAVRVFGALPRGPRPLHDQLERIRGFALFGLVGAFAPVSLGEAIHPSPAPAAGSVLLLFAAWSATKTEHEGRALLDSRFLIPLALAGVLESVAWFAAFGAPELRSLASLAGGFRLLAAFGACAGLRRVFDASGWRHHVLLSRAVPWVMLGGLLLELILPGGFNLPRKLSSLPLSFGYAAKAATLALSGGPPLALFFLLWRLRGDLAGEIYAERVQAALEGVPMRDRSARLAALEAIASSEQTAPTPGSEPRWAARAVWVWSAASLLGCCFSSALVNTAQLNDRPGGYRILAVPRDLSFARSLVGDREGFHSVTGVFLHTAPERSEWLTGQPSRDTVIAVWEERRLVLSGRFTTAKDDVLRWEPFPDLEALRDGSGLDLATTRSDRLDVHFPRRSWANDLAEFGEGGRVTFQRMTPDLAAADGVLLVEHGAGVGRIRVWRAAGKIHAQASVHAGSSDALAELPGGFR